MRQRDDDEVIIYDDKYYWDALRACGIGPEHVDALLTDFDPALQASTLNSLRTGKGVFAHGGAGTGKTRLLVAIFRQILCWRQEKGDPHLWTIFKYEADIFLELRRAKYYGSGLFETEIIDRLTEPDVLLLDDFASQTINDDYTQTMGTIIDRRYRHRKITCFSCNRTLKEISETIDDRLASRIYAMCQKVDFGGMDRRLIAR